MLNTPDALPDECATAVGLEEGRAQSVGKEDSVSTFQQEVRKEFNKAAASRQS